MFFVFSSPTPDKMKDGIIAKLANQAADYYGDAYKQCQYKDTLPKVSNPHRNNMGSAVVHNMLDEEHVKCYPQEKLTVIATFMLYLNL